MKSQALLSPRILTTLILDVRVSPGSDNPRVNVPAVPTGSCRLAAWKKQAFVRKTPRQANTERAGAETARLAFVGTVTT